ncbi:hypothetical protein L6R52_31995 [Myxococcota bacterium]|nr:hypothetical protein [Myxococcota bacterium]
MRSAVAISSSLVLGVALAAALVARPPTPSAAPRPVTVLRPDVLNGVALNGLFGDLGAGPLSAERLSADPTVRELLVVAPSVLRYTVQCALGPEQSVAIDDGTETHVFDGAIGLAPDWADGPCDEACQEWVSACLLARTNIYEIPVRIYIDGPHPALATPAGEEPDPSFSEDEGAFFGNLFQDPPRVYTCRGSGNDPLYLATRVCTLPGNRCNYQSLGACGPIDGDTGLPSKRHVCESHEDRSYRRCHNRPSIEGSDAFPEPSRVYERVITIRVRKSTFGGGVGAACLGGAPDGGVADPPDSGLPDPDGGITAGRQCASDEDCASALLTCDVGSPQPSCTTACAPSASQADEQAECGGPGTTCLGDGLSFHTCTRACAAGRRTEETGGCAPNRVCTGLWIMRDDGSDRAGCYTFCQTDADCAQGLACNPRLGACGEPVDPTKLPDGEPCTDGAECRGTCIATSTTAGSPGQCVSFVNLARTRACPDDPSLILPAAPPGDELAVCVFKQCRDSSECTAPLVCRRAATGDDACLPR